MPARRYRVMLLTDFVGANFPAALYALQQWCAYMRESEEGDPRCETVVGLSQWASRSEALPGCPNLTVREAARLVKEFSQGLPVVFWDLDVERAADRMLAAAKVGSRPSFAGFSYGAIVNRGLLLASEMDCDFLIRIDPGTCPRPEVLLAPGKVMRYDFRSILKAHIAALGSGGAVVSRSYKGRLSVRDDFVRPGSESAHCDLVAQFTGIDPRDQVTGGALFTSIVPGVPAISFEPSTRGPTLVWGSDDGRYQLLKATTGSRNLPDASGNPVLVPRFDAVGKPKTTVEYYRGLAGAVYLNALDHPHGVAADSAVEEFLTRLKDEVLHHETCWKHDRLASEAEWLASFVPDTVAPPEFRQKIREGWNRYNGLCTDWPRIGAVLRRKLLPLIQIT